MEQEKDYENVCFNTECIRNKNSFFTYAKRKTHIGHKVEDITPKWIQRMIDQVNKEYGNLLNHDKKVVMKKIDGEINKFCQQMTKFFREKYLTSLKVEAMEKIKLLQFGDINKLSKKLKSGDYQVLKEFDRIRNNTIENYPFYSFYSKQLKVVIGRAKQDIDELFNVFTKMMAVLIQKKEDVHNILKSNNLQKLKSKKQLLKQLIINRQTQKIDEPRGRIQSKDQSQRISESQDIRMRGQLKKKIIRKQARDQNHLLRKRSRKKEDMLQSQEQVSPHYRNSDKQQVSQLYPQQIIIHRCDKPEITFDNISSKYKNVKGIHIFSSKMANKQYLTKIFETFKSLTVLTLNCSHQFSEEILKDSVSPQHLRNIQKLQLKWDYNLFFKEKHISRDFPTIEKSKIENYSNTELPMTVLETMKQNSSLVLNSERKIQQLIQRFFDCSKIQSLHCYKPVDKIKQEQFYFAPISRLLGFKLTNLVTLNLSHIDFSDVTDFAYLIDANNKLTNISIDHWDATEEHIMNRVINKLSSLPNLKRFSFSCDPKLLRYKIKAECLFSLVNLEELYLNCITILDGTSRNSSLKGLSQLKKITHLSLYSCNQVYSDFFQFIDPQVLENLQFLNVGLTKIDDDFLKCLPKMKKLLYLNLDEVRVTGQGFLQACRTFWKQNTKYPPLKYLSIYQIDKQAKKKQKLREWSYSLEQIKEIGNYLPHLVYLDVSGCKNLAAYDFASFKKLSKIAIDRESAEKLLALPHVQLYIHQ